MKEVLSRIPLPVSGVALGLASLGNLLNEWSVLAHDVCGVLSAIIIALLLLKLALFPESMRDDLRNPILASVSGTFPMALMILSTYVSGIAHDLALAIWLFAILLHLALIVYFTKAFILDYDVKKVFASYFIVYVGIAVASCTCPFYDMFLLGKVIFWFGLATLFPLLIAITYRYVRYSDFPEPTFPLLCIYCAPVSLCLVGYVKSMTHISEPFLIGMYVLATPLYVFGLFVVLKTLTLRFYPSYAALTFPMVICATATNAMSKILDVPSLETLALIETAIACAVVAYVLIRYTLAIAWPSKG